MKGSLRANLVRSSFECCRNYQAPALTLSVIARIHPLPLASRARRSAETVAGAAREEGATT